MLRYRERKEEKINININFIIFKRREEKREIRERNNPNKKQK